MEKGPSVKISNNSANKCSSNNEETNSDKVQVSRSREKTGVKHYLPSPIQLATNKITFI